MHWTHCLVSSSLCAQAQWSQYKFAKLHCKLHGLCQIVAQFFNRTSHSGNLLFFDPINSHTFNTIYRLSLQAISHFHKARTKWTKKLKGVPREMCTKWQMAQAFVGRSGEHLSAVGRTIQGFCQLWPSQLHILAQDSQVQHKLESS